MTEQVMERIGDTGLVPVVVIDDAKTAVATAKALLAGGVDIMEITMRTAAGMESIRLVVEECPDILVGAGTILEMDQCVNAIKNGAKFIVSPGFDPEIVNYCIKSGVPICPGCVTPTEITSARNKGIRVVKFFPANVYGGIKAIKALAAPFTDVQFIPTGGVDLSNLADFVRSPIFAIGGGWLCKKDAINGGDFASITEACRKSIDVLLGLTQDGNPVSLDGLIEKGGEAATISMSRTASQLTRRGFERKKTNSGYVFTKGSVTLSVTAL